jgi:flagellar capping protein FliD
MEQIFTYVGGLLLAIIGYFLKKTLDDQKDLKILVYRTERDLEILKTDHINKYNRLEEKFDELYSAVKDLTQEIKSLNTQLSKKKDI